MNRCAVISARIMPGISSTWMMYILGTIELPGNGPPNKKNARYVPTIGMPCSAPSKIRRPAPDSWSSGSEYPNSPSSSPRVNSPTPISQLISRGLRYAPVKNTRSMWMVSAAMNRSAAQWWISRISNPPRMSKLMFSVDWYASLIRMPSSLMYEPW